MRRLAFIFLAVLQDSMPDWIEQLGDDDPKIRQAAFQRLLDHGKPALEPLRKAAAQHRDPQVRASAQLLIERIPLYAIQKSLRLWVTPEHRRYRRGDSVRVTLRLKNFGDAPFKIDEPNERNWTFELKGSKAGPPMQKNYYTAPGYITYTIEPGATQSVGTCLIPNPEIPGANVLVEEAGAYTLIVRYKSEAPPIELTDSCSIEFVEPGQCLR